MAQSFLMDMEAMDEEGGDERTRTTIKQIRRIVYDAEDVVESYILETNSSTDEKEGFFRRSSGFCSSLPRIHQVGCEIEAITEKLNKTMKRWKKYLGQIGVRIEARQGLNKKNRLRMRPITYSHTYEDHVVGLDEDINKLVGVLTDREHTKIKVVSIVGMGGSGKTTLARRLYNHESVKKQFDCLAWVSVSQQWDAHDLLKKVKEETMGRDESSVNEQVPVGKLYEYLELRNYLIVLDDVWEAKALKDIRPALPIGGVGGKIIVTTRKDEVVNYPDLKPLTYSHRPRRLTEEESWELFRKIAHMDREEINNSADIARLQELGKEMLKKCGGLPLAVIALAGILFDKENLEEWEKVSKAVSSRIMEEGKGTQLYGPVNEMLALSYIDLPCELKPCFLYLTRYPEDYKIHVGDLIRTWVAEGFVTSAQTHEGCTFEDVARQYLDELVQRCLVLVEERNYEGKVKRIKIHDLVRDLCIKKAKEEDFFEIFAPKAPNLNTTVTESRRAALFSPDRIYNPFPTRSKYLRSLAYEGIFCTRRDNGQKLSLEVINQNFRLLRVLLLERVEAPDSTLPTGIGSLIHLRYLGLKNTNIKELPSSIGNLRNLLTLDCGDEVRIHDVVWKMEGLRYLCAGPVYVDEIKLHTLKHLQKLKITEGGDCMLKELPCLSESVQKLSIREIRNQEVLEASFQCPSISFDRLHSLELWWMRPITLRNLKPIIHSQHLRKLTLFGRVEDRSSDIRLPNSIKKLELWHTMLEAEATLVALGKLPQLSYLTLWESSYMGIRWTCSAGEFPQLKELTMSYLPNLEEWSIERGAMPQLTTLEILRCRKLKKLPEEVKFITTLQILHLDGELEERVKEGEDAHIIQLLTKNINERC